MYCGYDLDFLTEGCFDNFDFVDLCYEEGITRFKQTKAQIRAVLDKFALHNGTLNGSAIQNNWFPQIEADIFISHSHSDEKTAIIFSEILCQHFGLTSFIDSCVWGNSAELLRLIDDKYCLNSDYSIYNYKKRNLSTSHVHMMLSSALMMMMDNCECVFFLNTPNSVNTKDVIDRTGSPWIYTEINMSRLIKRHYPKRRHRIQDSLQKSLSEEEFSVKIGYELNLSHFTKLLFDKFDEWGYLCEKSKKHPLDVLYALVPPNPQGVIYG